MDSDVLDRLRQDLAADGTQAFLVIHDGRLVHESYGLAFRDMAGGAESRLRPIASMAKAVVATTALLLCEADGLLDLDAPAALDIPSWRDRADRRDITLRQLASHTSGLANARYPEWTDGRVEPWEQTFWDEPGQRTPLAITTTPVVAPPGERVLYSNPGYSVLASVLARRLTSTSYRDVPGLLRARIMRPLGIDPKSWTLSYGETYRWRGLAVHEIAGGTSMPARVLARIGQMYLEHGRWDGQTVIAPSSLTHNLVPTRPRQQDGPLPALGWWSNANGTWPLAPRDTLVGAGAGHKLLVLIPSRRLVAVRLGAPLGHSQFGGDFWPTFDRRLLQPLLASVAPSPVAA